MVDIWKENARLVCSCGYESKRRGWNEMVEHLIRCHGVSPMGLSRQLQDLWFKRKRLVKM